MYQLLLSKFVYLIIECYNCCQSNLLSDLTNLWRYKYVEAIKNLTSAKSCLTILIFCKFPTLLFHTYLSQTQDMSGSKKNNRNSLVLKLKLCIIHFDTCLKSLLTIYCIQGLHVHHNSSLRQ